MKRELLDAIPYETIKQFLDQELVFRARVKELDTSGVGLWGTRLKRTMQGINTRSINTALSQLNAQMSKLGSLREGTLLREGAPFPEGALFPDAESLEHSIKNAVENLRAQLPGKIPEELQELDAALSGLEKSLDTLMPKTAAAEPEQGPSPEHSPSKEQVSPDAPTKGKEPRKGILPVGSADADKKGILSPRGGGRGSS